MRWKNSPGEVKKQLLFFPVGYMSLNSKVAGNGRDITYFILILFSAFVHWIIQSKNTQQLYTQFYLETGLFISAVCSKMCHNVIVFQVLVWPVSSGYGYFFLLVTKHHDRDQLKEHFILAYDSRGLDVHNGSEDMARTESWDITSRPHKGNRVSRKGAEDTNSQAHLLRHTSLVSFHILKQP